MFKSVHPAMQRDLNHDGRLRWAEFSHNIPVARLPKARIRFAAIDHDGDGQLSRAKLALLPRHR